MELISEICTNNKTKAMTTSFNYNKKTRATYFIVGFTASITVLSVLALHSFFLQFEKMILDFADHHYFLMAFATFLTSMYCLKGYLETNTPMSLKTLKKKTIYFIVGLTISITILSGILLHISLLQFEIFILEFTAHHYFLMAFAATLTTMLCLKGYLNTSLYLKNTKTKNKHQVNNQINSNLITQESFNAPIENTTTTIDKEKISQLIFPNHDVLNNMDEILTRKKNLQQAMILGNIYKQKVRIVFRDIYSQKTTETTIWYADASYVTLKGGVAIPLKSIIRIEI